MSGDPAPAESGEATPIPWRATETSDPSWTLSLRGGDRPPRVRATLLAVANGHTGTRGLQEEEQTSGSGAAVVANGVYDDGAPPSLLGAPRWVQAPIPVVDSSGDSWSLDMRNATLARTTRGPDGPIHTLRFASLARPECVVLRIEAPSGILEPGPALLPAPGQASAATSVSSRGWIAAAARDSIVRRDGWERLERVGAYTAGTVGRPDPESVKRQLAPLCDAGVQQLLDEHRRAWQRRWEDASVEIEGDPESELAARFAIFHLISSARPEGEAAVGARGLSGPAYRGHVFWDTDVFVLPFFAATAPEAARAILEYRVRRLPAAREEARRRGMRGARFPWESADDGSDVTPESFVDARGRLVPIRTGTHEEHIVADVAWAARHYAHWSGDADFLAGPGRDLVLDTARYWASRASTDATGRSHLLDVIGPDEYHELVDDNAFTNVLARANLRWAAELAERFGGADADETTQWKSIADGMVDGYGPQTGIYEQFAGYHELEPLLIEDLASPPIAADVLMGRGRIARTQLIKQADVLMLHHMLPEMLEKGSLEANLAHYQPRTAHGSSLSPAIHAALMARAGRVEEALEWFRLAARLDLDDLTGTTAGGIHLATMGGVWQALAMGFLGMAVNGGAIKVDPRLPASWSALTQSFHLLGTPVRVRATHGEVEVESDRPLDAVVCGNARTQSPTALARFVLRSGEWEDRS